MKDFESIPVRGGVVERFNTHTCEPPPVANFEMGDVFKCRCGANHVLVTTRARSERHWEKAWVR